MDLWVKAVCVLLSKEMSDGQSMMQCKTNEVLLIFQAVFFCCSLCASSQFLLFLMCSYHLSFPHICASCTVQ